MDLRQQVAELIDVPAGEIGMSDNLLDHGLDSVRIMTVVNELRAAGTPVEFADLAEAPTLADWERILAGR